MPTVPQYNREYSLNGAPMGYQSANVNGLMFGAGQAQALGQAAEGIDALAKAAINIKNTIDETKGIEFNNAIEQWKQDNLLDSEKGYYIKQGKDASGQTDIIMKNYDDFVKEWKDKNKVSRNMQLKIDSVATQKRTNIYDGVISHDLKQTGVWAKSEGDVAIQNAVVDAVSNRDNPDNIARDVSNAVNTAIWQAGLQKLDKATTDALIADYKSRIYTSVLDAKLQEGNLDAKQFFEEHKDDIEPKRHAAYIGAIKNEEDKYTARTMANNIIANSLTEQDAITAAEKIKDVNMSDHVISRIKQHYSQEEHYKNQQEKQLLNDFYNRALQAQQNGTSLSYDDIPDDLDAQTKLSLMNYVNKNGEPDNNNQIWEMLYERKVNDAQGFAKEDLNKYRGFLSDSEYKSFLKDQEDIKAGKFYTTLKEDDKNIKAALKSMGLDKGNSPFLLDGGNKRQTAFNEIQSLVTQYEARKGRKATDEELMNFTNSLGYKEQGVQLYKQLEKGMNERVNFTRDVINDFVYYQKTHDGKLPSDAEKMKIINNRLDTKVQEKKTQAQQTVANYSYNAGTMRNIAQTVAKPNEQKVLTYFADNQIPTIGKQLGLKLTVTDRYRNQKGSHHSEGRAADVSMSEHNRDNRIKIYERLVKLPTVQAIGTSDPVILSYFNGKTNKIVDERKYDRQHGTNHVNHAHVTLINYNPQNTKVAAKNGVYKF